MAPHLLVVSALTPTLDIRSYLNQQSATRRCLFIAFHLQRHSVASHLPFLHQVLSLLHRGIERSSVPCTKPTSHCPAWTSFPHRYPSIFGDDGGVSLEFHRTLRGYVGVAVSLSGYDYELQSVSISGSSYIAISSHTPSVGHGYLVFLVAHNSNIFAKDSALFGLAERTDLLSLFQRQSLSPVRCSSYVFTTAFCFYLVDSYFHLRVGEQCVVTLRP